MGLPANVLKIMILSGAVIFPSSHTVHSESNNTTALLDTYSSSIDSLIEQLRKKGYETENLFSHPKFKIYYNINSYFINSAESKGKSAYNIALKKGDPKEAERVFNEEYEKYKVRVGFDKKKNAIALFMQEYSEYLSLSEKKYDIPKEVIAAVIGIESEFGKYTGTHYAFNIYVSMYIKNYRKDFAFLQLEELLKFSERTKIDVYELNSSYAGAIGFMQFLPYSLNRWFVGNNVNDMIDNISSVANYLSHFMKEKGTLEEAIYSYNPSKFYVKTVSELANYGKIQ